MAQHGDNGSPDPQQGAGGGAAAADASPSQSAALTPAPHEEPVCPICQFIEAGPCKAEHQAWTGCRQECKQDPEKDMVEVCKDSFKGFFDCMVTHKSYYQPFLEMFGEAVAKAEGAAGEEGGKQPAPPQQAMPQPSGAQAAPAAAPATPATVPEAAGTLAAAH